jgi:UDP-N-acetylglucosamine 3-dehydrogenase
LIKVGFIGLGQMGRMHLVNCLHTKGAKVVTAADPSKKALNKAKALGVANLYTDYKELLDKNCDDLDAVIISVPNYLHFETIKLSLENGLNIFAEKPLAVNVKQCKEIVRLAQNSGRKFMMGHNLRFVPAVETIKEKLDQGVIGNLEVATIEEILNGPFSHPRVPAPVADWWFDPQKSGGGVLIDLGYHVIDLFRFFTEEDSKVVFTDLSYKYNLPVEEGARIILSTEKSSIRGIINVGWFQRSVFPKYNFRAILHGDSGYLSSEDFVPRKIYVHAAKEGLKNLLRRLTGRKLRPLSYTYYWESYYKELTTFFDCLEKDLETPTTAMDGLKTMQIIEEAYTLFHAIQGDKKYAKLCQPS